MTAAAQQVSMQGIVIPASSVNAAAFAAATRRQNLLMKNISAWNGFGGTDQIPILQTGIITRLKVRLFGTLTVTPGTGTAATTYRWPYGLVRAMRFTANGQSNLINAGGWALKLINLAKRFPQDDRGVTQAVGGAAPGVNTSQGTLSLASESWGVGQGVTALAAGNYDVELIYDVPVAYDDVSLLGAIFAQTSSTDLQLSIDYANLADVFTLTGNATVTFAGQVIVEGTVFTIPAGPNGGIVVPNLSAFHSVTSSNLNALANGRTEITLPGQGIGRQLMRLAFRVLNGASFQPLAMNAANFSVINWLYGGNTTPEQWQDGRQLRSWDESLYNVDVGGVQGYGVMDFSSEFAPRDSIDEGAATQLRFGFTIPAAVALTNAVCEFTQQTIVAGAVGAAA